MNPFFSIVIPTYNREHVIERTIRSVISQTFKNWELLIIDDGSTDNTVDIIKKFRSDTRISFHCFPNMGANVARNIGIGLSIGKYIAFLDSDDIWTNGRLQLIYENISEDALYITDFKEHQKKVTEIKERDLKCSSFEQLRLAYNFFGGTINIVAPKTTLQEIQGFDISLGSCQDQDIYNRLLDVLNLKYIPGEFAVYYLNSNNRISNSNRKLLGHIDYYKKFKSRMSFLSKLITKRKIAIVSYKLKSPRLFIYAYAWIAVFLLVRILNCKRPKDLYFIDSILMNKIKR